MSFEIGLPSTSSQRFGRGSISRVTGLPGLGFFRVALDVELSVEGRMDQGTETPRLTLLEADVSINGRPLGHFSPGPTVLPISPYGSGSRHQTVRLETDLDRARLEALETVRAGGNLSLNVQMQIRVDDQAQSAQEQFDVNQGVWVGVLEQMGFRRTLLIEVPVPSDGRPAGLVQAVALLGKAQEHMLHGRDRDTVAACREVLEAIAAALGDTEQVEPELHKVLFQGTSLMSKAERVRLVRRALRVMAHPAHHQDPAAAQVEWTRIDAAAMVTMTAGLLNELDAPGAT